MCHPCVAGHGDPVGSSAPLPDASDGADDLGFGPDEGLVPAYDGDDCEPENPIESPSAEDWEDIFWRDEGDPVVSPEAAEASASSSTTPKAAAASAPSTFNMFLPAGSWKTPKEDSKLIAPGCRIQRRVPTRCFQVRFKSNDLQYSKSFSWASEGSPTMDMQLQEAIAWTWVQYNNSKK